MNMNDWIAVGVAIGGGLLNGWMISESSANRRGREVQFLSNIVDGNFSFLGHG